MTCDHKFKKHGLGFKCSSCSYYTGTNDMLNKMIEGSKTKVKKQVAKRRRKDGRESGSVGGYSKKLRTKDDGKGGGKRVSRKQ
jgi:hypothetical protein